MSLWSRRSPTHRADLDDPTWEPPVLAPRHRDWIRLALNLVALVCLSTGLAASFADWGSPWDLGSPVGLLLLLVAELRSWPSERRVSSGSGQQAIRS